MSAAKGGSPHLAAAWALYQMNRHADCLTAVARALADDPQHVEAHGLRALALLGLGRNGEAMRAARETLALDPEREWAHRVDAIVLLESERFDPARRSIDAAIRLGPRSVEAWSLAAELELRRGEPGRAFESAMTALRIDPLHRPSLVRAAHAAARTKRVAEANDLARRAVAADPLSAAAHRALGVAAFAAGDRKTARSAFVEALRLDPNDESARSQLLLTIRSRSPLYRATLAVVRTMKGIGGRISRVSAIAIWAIARGVVATGVVKGIDAGVLVLVIVVFLLPLVILPLHDLVVWRDPFGRLLLHQNEKTAAAATALLVAASILLLAACFAFDSPACGGAASAAFIISTLGSLYRRARRPAASWRFGFVGALLLAEVVTALVKHARHADVEARVFSALFVATALMTFLLRKFLIGDTTSRAAPSKR